MTLQPKDGRGRWARLRRNDGSLDSDPFTLSPHDIEEQCLRFGVDPGQVEHDFAISQVLNAISSESDAFVFYGGTALSRTYLNGLRLSEDIDLLSVGSRKDAAARIDRAIIGSLSRRFEDVAGDPPLQEVRIDTEACIYQIGDNRVKIQLIDGRNYAFWPSGKTAVSMRYAGMDDLELTTFTTDGFACAKFSAWCDTTREAPRDLYDLWAMSRAGFITPHTARIYKKHGPASAYPREWMFPQRAPAYDDWYESLGHQCTPEVGPDEAYEAVVEAWMKATGGAEAAS